MSHLLFSLLCSSTCWFLFFAWMLWPIHQLPRIRCTIYVCVRAQSARNAREKMKVGIAVRFKLTATLKSKYFPMFGMNGKFQEIWILQVMSRAFSGPLPVESRILSCRRRPVHLSNCLTPTKGWNANHENLWVHSGVLKSKAPRISTFYYYICGTPRVALPWIASPSLWPPGWFHTGFALPKMQREYFLLCYYILLPGPPEQMRGAYSKIGLISAASQT